MEEILASALLGNTVSFTFDDVENEQTTTPPFWSYTDIQAFATRHNLTLTFDPETALYTISPNPIDTP